MMTSVKTLVLSAALIAGSANASVSQKWNELSTNKKRAIIAAAVVGATVGTGTVAYIVGKKEGSKLAPFTNFVNNAASSVKAKVSALFSKKEATPAEEEENN